MPCGEVDKAMTMQQVRLTSEFAKMPSRGSEHSAGYDLYAAHDTTIPAKDRAMVKTDIQIAVPIGCYGRVAPRSGLALKHGIDVGAGVIDADYRGDVGVVLFNLGGKDFEVKRGDRIAQLICEVIRAPVLHQVEDLSATTRGDGGVGSTGIQGVADQNAEMDVDGPEKKKAKSDLDAKENVTETASA